MAPRETQVGAVTFRREFATLAYAFCPPSVSRVARRSQVKWTLEATLIFTRSRRGTVKGQGETAPAPSRMLARKLLFTLVAVAIIVTGSELADYLVEIVLFPSLHGGYLPLATFAIATLVGAPILYYLISQRIDIERIKEELAEGIAYKERAVIEIQARSREAERARADAEAALERLRESESLYRLLADNSTDVITLWSPDGQRIYTSPSAQRAYGYSNAELLAMTSSAHLHPDDHAHILSVIQSMTPDDGPRTAECRATRKDGVEEWVEITVKKLMDQGVLSSTRLITARKRLEDELICALDEAKAALAVKADFLANMTHELRTPLNAIVGFSGLLKRSTTLAPADAHKIELISDASETLLQVVNDVLDFSKLEAGAFEFDQHPFDPRGLAESTLALLADQASAKDLTLRVSAKGSEGPLLGDVARLRQVLLNFASNAIKFTPCGTIDILVSQQGDGKARRLRIEVSDSGIGIRADQKAHIFERFTQADASVSRQYGGTGLGLAICKRIIEALGGQIGVESIVGVGSTFWFELSLPTAQELSPHEVAAAPSAAISPALRLLVVDDNAVNRELICGLLAPFELDIATAEDGVAAIEAVSRAPFDVILMDVQMPKMDGLTATRRIRSELDGHASQIPIIAMTANVLPGQVARCLEAGMDDHLGKPINPHELLHALDRWSAGRPQAAGSQAPAPRV